MTNLLSKAIKKTTKKEKKLNWSSYCSVSLIRNQCSDKNCSIYPICLIKELKKTDNKWNSDCSGCAGGHPSFWKTIIESPQWKKWEKEQSRRWDLLAGNKKVRKGVYDMPEVEECGWLGEKHWQDFVRFIIKNG